MKHKKLVLAYSGGLDTSYCLMKLSQEGYEVHAISVNTGGFDATEVEEMETKALQMGAHTYQSINALDSFYHKVVKYLVFGNVLKNNTYPLSVSAERIVQAMEIAAYAKKIGADAIAHGSTGAGNDQVRFDLIFQVMAADIEIITPIRDQQLSREAEIVFLKENGIDLSWEKAQYSINQGLWGTSVGGKETLTSHESLPESAYPSQLEKKSSEKVSLHFEKGELVGIDGQMDSPVNNIIMPDSLKELQTVSKTIPTLSSTYKFTFGAIYYKFTIVYFYKKNICITSSYVKINWGVQPYIETKNIIHDQNLKH